MNPPTLWRWFPAGLLGSMVIVFAVNGYMVYDAVTTFPGVAGTDGFDLSNGYDKVLETHREQSALGWAVDAVLDESRRPILHLVDNTGAPLTAATIEAQAERPVGPPSLTPLTFKHVGNGQFVTDTTLFSGQWDVMLAVKANGQTVTTTKRLIAR